MVTTEVKKGTCPKCGADRDILADCLSSPAQEDRFTAWIILENCPVCKEYLSAICQELQSGAMVSVGYIESNLIAGDKNNKVEEGTWLQPCRLSQGQVTL